LRSKDEQERTTRETLFWAIRRENPRGQKAQESRSLRPSVNSWGADKEDGSSGGRKSLRRRDQAGKFDREARERKEERKLSFDPPVGEKL